MTKKPRRKRADRPALPSSGGSFVRNPDGTLAPLEGAAGDRRSPAGSGAPSGASRESGDSVKTKKES